MKIRSFNSKAVLLLIFALVVTSMTLSAETVTADFNTGLPDGWKMVGNLYNDSDRARSGKGVYTSSKQDKTNYILTTEIEGDIEFYGRSYNTKGYGYITLFSVNDDNTPGDKLIEFRTDNVTSGRISFQKFSYTLDVPRRVAIDLYWSCIDDFTYTPAVATAEASLSITDFASGSSYDFGGTPVKAGTTHTFTLVNKGAGELTISSINVTGGYSITEGQDITSIGPKGSGSLTVATPAEDAQGVLTITSNDPDSPYTINLSSIYKLPLPVMNVDTQAINFGKVTETVSRNVSVSNAGDAPLTVEINTDSDKFSVIPPTLTVEPGEAESLTVTYNYEAGVYGTHSGTLTITPNVGNPTAISLSAGVRNPQAWLEEFNADTLPENWEAGTCWTFTDGVAKASYNYNDKDSRLTTPPLKVAANDELTFSYRITASFVTIKILASKNGGEYTPLASISGDKVMSEFETYTISGLTPGSYRFSFVNDDYELDDFDGYMLDMDAPRMELISADDAIFGKVTEKPEAITYTVANTGTGKLSVEIASDSEHFTVTPATLVDIEKGAPKTFTVNFEYDIDNPGEKNGIITVTPSYNEEMKVSFAAKAVAKNPYVWEEDFEKGEIPEDWENEGEWSVSTPFSAAGTGTQMAVIRSTEPMALTTPRLKAEKGAGLKFYIGMQFDDEPLVIEYSSDKTSWQPIDSDVSDYTESAHIVFTAPESGYYYIRFTGTYAMLDDFEGFRFAPKTHDLIIESQEIPATGYQFAPYSASVTVKETYGQPEEAFARLLVGGNEVLVTESQEIEPNGAATFSLTYVPLEAIEAADVQIEIVYAEELLVTETSQLTVTAAPVLDEAVATELDNGTLPALVVKYNAVNGWNTIAMPFALTDELLDRLFGKTHEVFELSGYADNTIEFDTPASYVAGHPYVVYANSVPEHQDIILNDVIIEANQGLTDECDEISFTAFFTPEIHEQIDSAYIIDPESDSPELRKATDNDFSKGFRAYLRLRNTENLPGLKLGTHLNISPVISNPDYREKIYNLQGIRVTQPSHNGIYIVNGRKIIMR